MAERVDETASRRIRVVVADDHWMVREGVADELEEQPDMVVTGTGDDGDAAVRLAQSHQPDVLVLDLRMPGLPAEEVVRQVCALPVPVRVVMLSAYDDPEHVVQMLQAGVSAYVSKDDGPAAISAAIRAVVRGQPWLSSAVAAKLAEHAVLKAAQPVPIILNEREVEVLRLVMQEKTNREIAAALGISPKTVEVRLGEIFGKMGVVSRVGAALVAERKRLV
jgi:DNA-binding NarL/FixJ family response regulator